MITTPAREYYNNFLWPKAIYSTYMARVKKHITMGIAIINKKISSSERLWRNPWHTENNSKLSPQEKLELQKLEAYRKEMSDKLKECVEIGNPNRLKQCEDPYYLEN